MFNNERYIKLKTKIKSDLGNKVKCPFNFMMEYKQAIVEEDYEKAKAITEVLRPLNYETSDTHGHIKELSV